MVLDGRLRPVPVGVRGELYLAGAGLARGYHRRPALDRGALRRRTRSARRAPDVPDRRPGALDERPGRARLHLEYLGRTDFQVKIRGFRIELGEIDAALTTHPTSASRPPSATRGPSGDTVLVSYVQPANDAAIAAAELTAHLAAPAARAHGAARDRRARRDADDPGGQARPEGAARTGFVTRDRRVPGTGDPTEETVAGVFAEVLGVERIGIDDSFFDLGGNSLIATRVVARINAVLGSDIGVARPVRGADRRGARRADRRSLGRGRRGRPVLAHGARDRTGVPLSLAQQRMWFVNQFDTVLGGVQHPDRACASSGELDVEALARGAGRCRRTARVAAHRVPATRRTAPSSWSVPAAEVVPDLDAGAACPSDGLRRTRSPSCASAGFDVTTELPVRAALLRLGPTEHVLVARGAPHRGRRLLDGAAGAGRDGRVRRPRARARRRDWAPLRGAVRRLRAVAARAARRRATTRQSALAAVRRTGAARSPGAPDVLELPTDRPRPAAAVDARGATSTSRSPRDLHRDC